MEEREHVVGKSVTRVDALEKVTGRAKYTEDLCDKSAYIARVLHADIAHGIVRSVDTSEAQKLSGVVKIVTCFDVPKYYFPTAGHPWSTDPAHQDVKDRLLLTEHVRFYGDDVAAVVAENEVAAAQALRLIKVEYDPLPFVLDVQKAMEEDAPQLHENYPGNVLKHTSIHKGDFEKAKEEPGLIKVEGWYQTPTVQHCHIENFICYAYMEQGRYVIVSSTQIPHICRRVVGQALGIPWGNVRVIKPYIGGGFGNKQDILYEPLCAYLSQTVGGRLVKLDVSREETFVCNRVRHAIRTHLISYVRPNGEIAARKAECFSDQGAYASHGHSIGAKALGSFPQLYPCENFEGDVYTVFTNKPVSGAMRGYGIPQAMFAMESHTDDIAVKLGIPPYEYRWKYLMPKGYTDGFSKNVNYYDTFRECMEKGSVSVDYERKRREYAQQTGDIRKGIGMAAFWYNTGVWPISLETSSCRMVMNQDGSIQVQVGETEIGQGADTAFAQMAAETLGIPFDMVHVMTMQDTDITPFGLGAYASRQTYMAGFSAAGKIQNVIGMVAVSMGATIATYVGQNRGAGRMDRVKQGVKYSWIMLLVWSVVEMALVYFGGKYFTYLFISPSQTDVVQVSVIYFRTVFWAYPFLCTIFVFRNALQGMGYGMVPMLGGVFELVARTLIVVLVAGRTTFAGVCLADPMAWIAALIPLIPYYYYVMGKHMKAMRQ